MFIRFVSGEIHEDSLVSTGLFQVACDLLYDPLLPDEEYYPLRELMDWFNAHLKGPCEFRLRTSSRALRAICWFKPTAHERLSRAWQMALILERNDVFIPHDQGRKNRIRSLRRRSTDFGRTVRRHHVIAEFAGGELNAQH